MTMFWKMTSKVSVHKKLSLFTVFYTQPHQYIPAEYSGSFFIFLLFFHFCSCQLSSFTSSWMALSAHSTWLMSVSWRIFNMLPESILNSSNHLISGTFTSLKLEIESYIQSLKCPDQQIHFSVGDILYIIII